MPSQTFELGGLTWSVLPMEPDEQIEVECILLQVVGPSLGAALAAVVQGLAPALVEMLRETVSDSGQLERAIAEVEGRLADSSHIIEAEVTRHGDGETASLLLTFADQEAAQASRDLVAAEAGGFMDIEDLEGVDLASTLRLVLCAEVIESAATPFEISRLLSIDTSDPRLHIAWERFLDALAITGGDLVRDAVMALSGRVDHRDILRLFELVLFNSKRIKNQRSKTMVGRNGKPEFVSNHKALGVALARTPRGHLAKWHLLGRALMVTYGPPPVLASKTVGAVDVEAETEGPGGE